MLDDQARLTDFYAKDEIHHNITFFLLYSAGVLPKQKFWILDGTMNREGSIMNIAVEFKMQATKTVVFFNSPSQKASGIPLDSMVVINDSVQFQLMSEPINYFKCKISKDKINGEFTQEGFSKGSIYPGDMRI
ncbi:hypothetical protein DU508_04540 [Pedobacter chinensis]|uniref:Uncharacterized protein n=1 Tax=Pedobacter chinensis TaxID=2282421 RepID=A0A369Q415_9SPHI|nr:hypothetical protein [Pedobacter chinensis]RDC58215.1 hypothetical protein DU508_04540 [Pedobacter chinensis]